MKKDVPSKESSKARGNEVTALVLGILALVFSIMVPFVGILLGIAGIVYILFQSKENQKTPFVRAGMILAIVGLVLAVLSIIALWVLYQYYPEVMGLLEGAAGVQ